jgi:hypothetical protein
MVTKAEEPRPDPNPAESVIRNAIAGHPQGSVRRIILYVALFACVGVAFYVPYAVVPALVCGVLLLATDNLV